MEFQRTTLGPALSCAAFGNRDLKVRISDDIRTGVVFLGHADARTGKGGIHCIGTGFLVQYGGAGYLVTAAHVAAILGSDPFVVRLNTKKGDSVNIQIDMAEWFYHPDDTVDLALIPFVVPSTSTYDAKYLNEELILTNERIAALDTGLGDFTYTIGLFRLLHGERRNLPIVHSGHIALMPSDEKIPVRDWRSSASKKPVFVSGYLVETNSLRGLSGSPVYVRPWITNNNAFKLHGEAVNLILPRSTVYLLGVWQASWDAPPDEVMAVETGRDVQVSVGMGIVVPAQRIIEILEMDKVKRLREENMAFVVPAASLDSVAPAAVPNDANPTHREDFNSLLGAAVKTPARED